jgi:hypothetical protein
MGENKLCRPRIMSMLKTPQVGVRQHLNKISRTKQKPVTLTIDFDSRSIIFQSKQVILPALIRSQKISTRCTWSGKDLLFENRFRNRSKPSQRSFLISLRQCKRAEMREYRETSGRQQVWGRSGFRFLFLFRFKVL